MKITKTFVVVLFTMFTAILYGQSVATTSPYIKNSVTLLKTQLQKSGTNLELSDAQILKLEKIFAVKEPKFKKITDSGMAKGDMSTAMSTLDKEFAAQIEAVLSPEQKAAYRKASRSLSKQ